MDNQRIFDKLENTDHNLTTALIRWMVGFVFLSEGIQKLVQPEIRGAGRFEKIGLPAPEVLGTLIGTTEVFYGTLLVVGFFVRIAALPLLTIMAVALISTKWPILTSQGFGEAAHASRTDFCMSIGSLFVLLRGAGGWSLDARRTLHKNSL